jgi:hypothetical protein
LLLRPRLPRARAVRRALPLTLAAATLAATTGCASIDGLAATTPHSPGAALSAGPTAPPPGSRPERISPLRDTHGLHPGLTPVPAAERGKARKLIGTVTAGTRGSKAGYDRERHFGTPWTDDVHITWGHDGCRTREQVLHRDMKGIDFRAGTGDCVVLVGILQEPYTGRTIEFSKSRPMEVQVDHVMPLAYDWGQGARTWTQAKREQLANDPLNLLAVDGPANQRKSDSGPSEWMPGNTKVRCAYAVRFAMVSLKYALPVTSADKRTMLNACGA